MHSLPTLVLHVLAAAYGLIGRMAPERSALRIELLGFYLAAQVGRGRKLDNLMSRDGTHLVGTLIVIMVLVFGLIHYSKGTEAFDRDTGYLSLAEAISYLVEHMWKDRLDGRSRQAATLNDVGGKLF